MELIINYPSAFGCDPIKESLSRSYWGQKISIKARIGS